MENSSGTISGHWPYCRYWRPPPKKPNNENENPLEAIQTKTCTKTNRKRSKRQKKIAQKNSSQAENTSNVFQNKRNFRLRGVQVISTEVFINSALSVPSTDQFIHGKSNLIHNESGEPSKYVALDCEMVAGLGYPPKYRRVSLAARVSLVNEHLECVYNQYVKPKMKVVDYGTRISGITKKDLDNYGKDFDVVQQEVAAILKGKVLVGHAIHYDMNVLYLSHPAEMMRDTAQYAPLTKYNRGKTPSLKVLAKEILDLDIQEGAHDSIIDATASMQLYLALADEWEAYIVRQIAIETQMKRLKEDVWYDKWKYSNAECRYHEILARKAKASKSETSDASQPTNKTISTVKLETVNSNQPIKQKKTKTVAASSVNPDGRSKDDLNKSNRHNRKSVKFLGVPDSTNGLAGIPNTPVQQALYRDGDRNRGAVKSEVLKELSDLDMAATCYLKMAIEPLTVSLEFLLERGAIQTRERIGKQVRSADRCELDNRVDEVSKLVDAIKATRNT